MFGHGGIGDSTRESDLWSYLLARTMPQREPPDQTRFSLFAAGQT
jgi:hypothetical protein